MLGGDAQQVLDEPLVKAAATFAGSEQFIDVKKKNGGGFRGDDVADQLCVCEQGIIFGKNRPFIGMTENMAFSGEKIYHDIDAAGFDKTDFSDPVSGMIDDFVLLVCFFTRVRGLLLDKRSL